MTLDPVVEITLRGSLALLFATAAGHKLREPERFLGTLEEYRLVPGTPTLSVALAVGILELGLAAGLVLPFSHPAALTAAAGVLAVYSGAIAINLARGRRHIDCGCAGAATLQPLSGGLLLRNAALIAAALFCLLPARSRPLVWIDVGTIAASVVVLSALYGATNRLLATWPELARLRRTA